MTLADVNVLIYAFRPDAPKHRICKDWLESVVHGDARYGVSPLALSALVRITTNTRAFRDPSPIAEVFAFCERLLREPNAVTVEPGERHWTSNSKSRKFSGFTNQQKSDSGLGCSS